MTVRHIVAGAPCAGKSTFVRQQSRAGDLIYDYDTLHGALSGQSAHQHLDVIRPYVLAARDTVFDELEGHEKQSAWILTSTRSAETLRAMRDRFGADVVFLSISREEAHQRCDADDRPAEWHEYIDKWFDESDIRPEDFPPAAGGKMAQNKQRKTYRGRVELKADDGQEGEFRCEFATLNAIDHDEDVTPTGAFQDGQETLIEPWNHDYRGLPVGKGVIHEEDDKAVFDGRFFLDTENGREHYKTVKNIGDLQEWSYTFEILESDMGEFEEQEVRFLRRLDVWGVAPVQRGAGIDTRTVDIKGKAEGKEREIIREIGKLAIELGAKCAELEDGEGGDEGDGEDEAGGGGVPPAHGKSSTGAPSIHPPKTLAERIAIDLVEYGIDDKE